MRKRVCAKAVLGPGHGSREIILGRIDRTWSVDGLEG